FFWIGIQRGLFAMLLGHVALSLPYVIVVVGARLRGYGTTLEEAAATLGATPWQTFWRVSAPVMAPGVVAAALFAFAVSFDQFVISYFLAPPASPPCRSRSTRRSARGSRRRSTRSRPSSSSFPWASCCCSRDCIGSGASDERRPGE